MTEQDRAALDAVVYVIVIDRGHVVGPFGSRSSAVEYGRAVLDPDESVWRVEQLMPVAS